MIDRNASFCIENLSRICNLTIASIIQSKAVNIELNASILATPLIDRLKRKCLIYAAANNANENMKTNSIHL